MIFRVVIWLMGSAIAISGASIAQAADPIRCNCLFAQSSGYVGVGTRATCSTFTEKNKGSGETCQIAFGGNGYQEPLLSKLNIDAKQYREMVFSITMNNLTALHDGVPEKFVNSDFLRNAIPVYMRAAYLRTEAGLDDATLLDLDKEVRSVSAEYAGPIADVFLGRAKPFEAVWRERHRVSVDRGAVRFVYAGELNLVAVFFDPERR